MCLLCIGVVVRIRLYVFVCFFFFQAEDGIRDLVRSRGLGDVYKRQELICGRIACIEIPNRDLASKTSKETSKL